MKSTEQLKSRLHLSTASFLIAAMSATVSTGAIAQDTDTSAEEEAGIEEVVITGSRIKRTGFDTVQPATVVDSEFLDIRGFDNVATALNELPGFTPTQSNNGNQSSQTVGQNFVNAFGLGTQRTLTLINGRRTVGQNTPTLVGTGVGAGLQVDLNIIPTALVERVETVFTGGAPIYGSDAIAGTVNLILKDDFEGFSAEAQYGFSHQGDAENYRVRSLLGGNFADGRGNVTVALEYSKQDGLLGTDRSEYINSWRNNCTNTTGAESPDGNVYSEIPCYDASAVWQVPDTGHIIPNTSPVPFALAGDAAGQNIHRFGLADEDGDIVMFDLNGDLIKIKDTNPGIQTQGNPSIFFSVGTDAANNPYYRTIAGETTSIRSPLERYHMMSTSHYDISDNVTIFFEGLYSRSESEDVSNQPAWGTNFFEPDLTPAQINIADNPWVSDRLKTLLETQGAYDPADPDAQYFLVTRSNADFDMGGRLYRDQEVFRGVVGLRGDFELGDRTWSWETSYTFGQTHATAIQATMNFDRYAMGVDAIALTAEEAESAWTSGDIAAGHYAIRNGQTIQLSGSDPLRAGDIVCRGLFERPEDPLAGGVANPGTNHSLEACVPVNVMGWNVMTPEARDYVMQEQVQLAMMQQSVVEANISGDLFDLPAGAFAVAMGYTYRSEVGAFSGGQGSTNGIDPNPPVQNVRGSFYTNEVYMEAFLPLIAGEEGMGGLGSIIQDWNFEAAIRYVDNSRSGGDYTWTVGTRVVPNILDGTFTFRGNYTQAIRSPSIVELFSPTTQQFSFASDPCDPRFIDGGEAPATRRANCEAEFAAFDIDPDSFNARSNNPAGTTPSLDNYTAIIVNASQPGTTGGNQDLQNEESKAWSVGMIFEPTFVPGLTLSADWTEIEMENVIVTPTATQLANACYDNPEYPQVFVGGLDACSAFNRQDGSFQFAAPHTPLVNAATRVFSGLQVNATYAFELADIAESLPGNMRLSGNFFYREKDIRTTFGSAIVDNTHLAGFEKYTWNVNMMYAVDKFSTLIQWRHIGQHLVSNTFPETRREVKEIPGWDVVNMTLRYQLNDNLAARVVINNLFDDRGDTPVEQGSVNGIRDQIGRTYLFAITADF